MPHSIALYGRDHKQMAEIKKARSSPTTHVRILEISAFKGDVESVNEVLLTEPIPAIFKAYQERNIPVALITAEKPVINPATNQPDPESADPEKKVAEPLTSVEQVEQIAKQELEEAKKTDPFVEASDEQLKAALKKATGRTPSDLMPRDRVIQQLIENGVTELSD